MRLVVARSRRARANEVCVSERGVCVLARPERWNVSSHLVAEQECAEAPQIRSRRAPSALAVPGPRPHALGHGADDVLVLLRDGQKCLGVLRELPEDNRVARLEPLHRRDERRFGFHPYYFSLSVSRSVGMHNNNNNNNNNDNENENEEEEEEEEERGEEQRVGWVFCACIPPATFPLPQIFGFFFLSQNFSV